jgi:hypothetical protein
MPTLKAGLSYTQRFPIPGAGPLFALLTGSMSASARFKFGYDTFGLRTYVSTGDLTDIFEGFYVDAAGTGIHVNGHIGVGAELNLAVASAGAEGGLDANVNFNLNDPEGMGRVRPKVLAAEFKQGPLCIFTASGQVTAGLTIYAKVPILGTFELNPPITSPPLLNFSAASSPLPPTIKITPVQPAIVAGSFATFTVSAVDLRGKPVPMYRGTVRFTSPDSPKAGLKDYTFTEGDKGVHTFEVNVGTLVGVHSVTVTDTLINQTVTGSVMVTPGPASTFDLIGPAQRTAGQPGSYTVTALDMYGNVATGYRGTVHFTSTDPNPQAILPADYPFTTADNGKHRFDGVSLVTANLRTLKATDTAKDTITGSADILVAPDAASQLTLTESFPSPTTAGNLGVFEVTALDRFGNTATGYMGTVTFASDDLQADLPVDYPFQANDNGRHLFDRISLKTAGLRMLTATDTQAPNLAVEQFNIMVVPAYPALFLVGGFPDCVPAGTVVTVTVSGYDAYSNLTTNYRGTIHFSSNDRQAILPADYTFTDADNGRHAFNGVSLRTAGQRWIKVADTRKDLPQPVTGMQSPITVINGEPDHIRILFPTSQVTDGQAFFITVLIVDQFNNTVTGGGTPNCPAPIYTGTVTFSSDSDPGGVLPTDYPFKPADAGRNTFQVVLASGGKRKQKTISAHDTLKPSLRGEGTVLVVPPA